MITTPSGRFGRAFPDLDAAARSNFRLDAFVGLTTGVFMAFVLNFVTVVARRLDASPFLISVILAAPFLGSFLTIFSGYWAPRRVNVVYIAVLLALGRGFPMLAGVSDSVFAFTLIVVGMYVFSTLPSPQMVDVWRRLYPDRYRGRLIGLVRVAMTGTATLASPAAGWLLDVVGPRVLFPLGAVFGLLSALAYGRIRVKADEDQAPRFGLASLHVLLRKDRRFALYILGLGCWGFGFLLGGALYPVILVDRLQASYSQVGVLSFVTSLSWLLSYFYWGSNVDRRGPFAALVLSMLLTAVVPLVYLLSPSVWYLAIASFALGVASGGLDLAGINALIRLAPPQQVPQYGALLNAIAGIRGMAAPFLGAALAAVPFVGPSGVLVLAAVLILTGAAILWRIRHST